MEEPKIMFECMDLSQLAILKGKIRTLPPHTKVTSVNYDCLNNRFVIEYVYIHNLFKRIFNYIHRQICKK
jgi:hypothetical protein